MKLEEQRSRQKITNQEGWISIAGNIVLFAIKLWVGIVSGSLAIIADAWHTLSDSVSSLFVIVSAKFSYKKPDKTHPYGHGRFELVTSIFIGMLLVIVGYNFIKEGVVKFIERGSANYGTLAIVVTIFSAIVKEVMSQFAMWGYRKTGSDALKADGWHHRSDAISSVVLLVGILVGRYIWWIDSFLSVLVALFIIYTAYKIIKDSISRILGEGVKPDLENELKAISEKIADRDVYLHHVHLHNYVLHRELTFHICLPPDMQIDRAHDIITEIEDTIRKELNIETTIHVDPIGTIPAK